MSAKVVYVVGDVHGNFRLFNSFIDERIRKSPVLPILAEECGGLEVTILQVGDLAYFWPGYDNFGKIKNEVLFCNGGAAKIYWCGGNHEDWDRLDSLFAGPADAHKLMCEVDNGIFFCRFGATLDLAPHNRVLFAGGAESIDKQYRLSRMAQGSYKIWWEQEGISDEDMTRLADVSRADWVISHTAPMLFDLNPRLADSLWKPKKEDELSRYRLDEVFARYKPGIWFFGHFHKYMKGEYGRCHWEGLSDIEGREIWWQGMRLA